MTLRPLNLTLARSAIRDGVTLIRSGHIAAGLRLIEHSEQYLAGFVVAGDAAGQRGEARAA